MVHWNVLLQAFHFRALVEKTEAEGDADGEGLAVAEGVAVVDEHAARVNERKVRATAARRRRDTVAV